MAKLLSWIRQASTRILDPEKEERVNWFAREVEKEMTRRRGKFEFQATLASLEVPAREVSLVAKRTYELALKRAWRDRVLTPKERAALDWIARAVDLDFRQRKDVEERIGRMVFENYLGHAMEDGVLDAREAEKLRRIADGMGKTVRELVLGYFRCEGEAFLRGVFAQIIADDRLTEDEWKRLVDTTQALGLREEELLTAIKGQGERFVEHVLADAKADGQLSEDEEKTLRWLLERLRLRPDFRDYVEGEIGELRTFGMIAEGRLPSVEHEHVSLRAGEIVHFQGYARYDQIRHLKSGVRVDSHTGVATITDARLVFSADTKSFALNHRKVVDIIELSGGIQVRSSRKGAGNYDFGRNNKLAYAIYRVAVGKANQVIVEKSSGVPTRHISRDVRQRVWQKYGGRCADCEATQYLEFDHIIPVAKGGSNMEANIQLLCRKCNLKKSDRI